MVESLTVAVAGADAYASADRRGILVFGDVIDDIVVAPRGTVRIDTDTEASITRRPGGSAANVAAWLGTLGADVRFLGRVEAHDVERHTRHLAGHGVRVRLIADETVPTGTIIVIVSGSHRTFLTERGANIQLSPSDVTADLLAGVRALHFTGYTVFGGKEPPEAFRALIERCHRRGIIVSVDASSSGFLEDFGSERFLSAVEGADILFPNESEARVLTGTTDPFEAARILSRRFPVVAVKVGGEGVVVTAPGLEPTHIPAVEVADIVDATGAGDAFAAGFLNSWLTASDAIAAAKAGGAVAARALGVVGGHPG